MKTFKKIILDDLKAQGLDRIACKIKSITHEHYANGNTLRVSTWVISQGDRTVLQSILNEYKEGYFDGMTDSYVRKPCTKERSAMFIDLITPNEENL